MCKLLGGEYKVEVFREQQVSILSRGNRGGGPEAGLEWQAEGQSQYSECGGSPGKFRVEKGGDMTMVLTDSLWILGGEQTGRGRDGDGDGEVGNRKTIVEVTVIVQMCAFGG